VPSSIAGKEYLPLLQENPAALSVQDMEMTDPEGKPVNPEAIDFSKFTEDSFPFNLRQRPSGGNALGKVKFLFPNKHAIYLHDTPARSLFSRARRAFSHGCIRVGKPLELGEQLLRANGPEWTRAHIQEIIDSGKTTRITLERPVPILILYMTAVVDGRNGDLLQFRPDIYDRDGKVWKALTTPPLEKGREILAQFARQREQEW
jgi:murein L,D-transpeptidase YcbB/YkuD